MVECVETPVPVRKGKLLFLENNLFGFRDRQDKHISLPCNSRFVKWIVFIAIRSDPLPTVIAYLLRP